ncbi:MAG TPA: hypothetical protein VFG74_10385 [Miltoncostaeaceae bacterium]|nr:hypothetical protein [Miltoncostaeaceae bacterium]
MADDDEFDQRNPFLLAMLGLVALVDEHLADHGDAGAPPVAPGRDEPLLR